MLNFPTSPSVGQIFSNGDASWTWDGVKWVASTALIPPDVTIVTPTSGSIVAMDSHPMLVDNPARLESLTIRLPPSPVSGTEAEVSFSNPVTALSVTNSASAPVAGAPTNAYGPGSALVFKYTTVWKYWK